MNFPVPEPSTLSLCLTHTLISVLVFWVVLSWVYKRLCSFILTSVTPPTSHPASRLAFPQGWYGIMRKCQATRGWTVVGLVSDFFGKWFEVTPLNSQSRLTLPSVTDVIITSDESHLVRAGESLIRGCSCLTQCVWVDAFVCVCLFVCVG